MDQQKASLCVSLHNVEFAKEYHYFLTLQLGVDGEKRRTDVSPLVKNPVFTASVFVFPLKNFKIDINETLHFAAFVVTDRSEKGEAQGQARLLGETTLQLGPLTTQLTDISGTGVRQNLKFQRLQADKMVTVGRFIVNLKLVGEELIPVENADKLPLEKDDIFHDLPVSDPFMKFKWRLRVDVRSAIDLPLNNTLNGMPASFVEVGWTLYDKQAPDDYLLYLTKIIELNRHPIYNTQFLIPNPETVVNPVGFLYLGIKDRHNPNPIDQIFIPIDKLKPYFTYNFEILSANSQSDSKPRYYISVCLESQMQSFVDNICDIVVKMVHFDPFPYNSRMFLAMTLNSFKPKEMPFVSVNLAAPGNIQQAINDYTQDPCFISSIMKIPPNKMESLYDCVAVFTLPKSMMDKNICFFISARDDSIKTIHAMPNAIVGHTDVVDLTLKKLFFSKEVKQAMIPVTWQKDVKIYPQFSQSKCLIELGCVDMQDKQSTIVAPEGSVVQSQYDQNNNASIKSYNDQLADRIGVSMQGNLDERMKWEILSRELSQKQEIIHRMLKEIDEKTDSLKITGAEIVDLRRQIKLLQSENQILRKRLAQDENLEINAIITKEIHQMSVEELRNKIIKIAQSYRNERVRNEEFEKALKSAQKDISNAKSLQNELETLQKVHQENAKRLLAMQQEIQKIGLYKETIKKQEMVIGKLEKLMESSLKDSQKSRQAQLELENLKTENINLQKQLKGIVYGEDLGELEKYRNECRRLEKIIANLKEELRSKRPMSSGGADWENEKMQLEVMLHNANARIDALQNELSYNTRNQAKEIAQLKMIIAEKQALLDSLTLGL